MTRKWWLCLFSVILFAAAGATCLMCEVSPAPDIERPGGPWKRIVEVATVLLRWPIRTADASDIRCIVPLIALGLGCLLIAADGSRYGSAASGPPLQNGASSRPTARSTSGARGMIARARRWRRSGLNSAEAWIGLTALGVVGVSLASMAAHQSVVLSWGWVIRFATGAAWAILLARTVSTSRARQVVLGMLGVAGAAMLLSLAHRADRGYLHFHWPIGPITITGALASLWAAMAGALAVGRSVCRFGRVQRILVAVLCLLAVYVLQQTGRRAPAVGLGFAGLATAGLLLRGALARRAANAVMAAAVVLAVAAAIYYTQTQARSSAVEVAGPVTLRFEYWRLSAKLIAEAPLLGHGPDLFVAKMTNVMAPLRAYAPHVYHGTIDPHAHNEWLQAAVELGVPGALLYLALPLGVIAFGIRRLDRGGGGTDQGVILCLISGVVAIMVLDAASITLRGPIMPIWYWTLLGLLASCARDSTTGAGGVVSARERDGCGRPRKGEPWRVLRTAEGSAMTPRPKSRAAWIGLSVFCFCVAAVDFEHSRTASDRDVRPNSTDLTRLWADATLPAWRENALRAVGAAIDRPCPESLAVAESLCKELYAWWPGIPESSAAYADILLRQNRTEDAKLVLEDALSQRWNPFNRVANILYAERIATDARERLFCVQRALRASSSDDTLKTIALQAIESPLAKEAVERELPQVRRMAADEPTESARGAVVELLRISSLVKEHAGLWREAAADQRLATEFYRRLEQANHPYRRRSSVETEAFQTLARLLYSADHGDYQAAYEAIIAAERYAVLGMKHAYLAEPSPQDGFVGGEVVPTEYPEVLRPLWQLSSLLHIVAGREEQLMARIFAGLPQAQWNDDAVRRELARLYRQAAVDLTSLPATRRPAHYQHVLEMADRLESSISALSPRASVE